MHLEKYREACVMWLKLVREEVLKGKVTYGIVGRVEK
jgi:hypothetical protein